MLNEINKLVDESISSKTISAIAIELTKNGNNIFSYHKGSNFFQNTQDDYKVKYTPINEFFIFDLASLTKVISGFTLFCDLINKKSISLKTEIGEIFSNNAIYINPELAKTTISSLLNHSSGLVNYIPFYNFCSTKSCIYSYIRNLNLEYTAGSKHIYSDIGYILLGEIFELYYESKLNDIFQNVVIKNLNIKDIGYVLTNSTCPRAESLFVSTGYSKLREKTMLATINDENAYLMNGESLHAGLFGTAREVSNYGKLILDVLKSRNENLIFKKDILENLIQRNSSSEWTHSWHYPSENSSGGTLLSKNSIGMTGFTGTSLWLDLDKDISITILANRTISDNCASFGGEIDKFSILRPQLHDQILRNFT